MEIKVKAVDAVPEKSAVEVEEALLKKHEEEQHRDETPETTVVETENNTTGETETEIESNKELEEKDVLSYFENKYGKEITSLDELMDKRDASPEMPEDVEAFLKYKKETGRGIEDFVKLNKDYSEASDEKILVDYFMSTEEGLDIEDVDALMADYEFDEDLDEEKDIKKKKLAKKRAVTKARKFFDEQREKYKVPLESSTASNSSVSDDELAEYKKHLKDSEEWSTALKKKHDWFLEKTDEVFGSSFKGFEFELGKQKVLFAPNDAKTMHNTQVDVNNFIGKYTDKDGYINKPTEYHRALAIAMNPEKFAQFCYEQGKADAVESSARKSKNIDMEMRRAPETTRKGALQIKSVSPSSNNNGLKIRSAKRT